MGLSSGLPFYATIRIGRGNVLPAYVQRPAIQAHVYGCTSVGCVLPPSEIPKADVLCRRNVATRLCCPPDVVRRPHCNPRGSDTRISDTRSSRRRSYPRAYSHTSNSVGTYGSAGLGRLQRRVQPLCIRHIGTTVETPRRVATLPAGCSRGCALGPRRRYANSRVDGFLNFGLKHAVEEIKTAVMPWSERDLRLR